MIDIAPSEKDLSHMPDVDFDVMEIPVNHLQNLHAAKLFIERLDKYNQKTGIKVNEELNQNGMGMIYGVEGGYDTQSVVQSVSERYGIPLIMYGYSDAKGNNHATLVLKMYQDGNNWRMIFWDPRFSPEFDTVLAQPKDTPIKTAVVDDELLKSIVMKPQDLRELAFLNANAASGIRLYGADGIIRRILSGEENGYDLTLEGDRDLSDPYVVAKNRWLQDIENVNDKNCVPYSMFNGILRTAAKYTRTDHPPLFNNFFNRGVARFQNDFGIHIQTRDEILKK